jgi:hypothetical protein
VKRTILACVAVALVAGATTATAASLITSADIKNGSIRNKDIKKGTISQKSLTPEIQALLAQVRADGGIPGPPGAKGDKGDPGAPGVANLEHAHAQQSWTGDTLTLQQASVACPAGKVALGGGFETDGSAPGQPTIVTSSPTQSGGGQDPNGWLVEGYTGTPGAIVRAHVICANVDP